MRNARYSFIALGLIAGSAVLAAAPVVAAPPERSVYLVTFVDGTNAQTEAALLRAQNYSVSYVYENLFPGVAVELPAAAATALANNPQVALIEPDGVVTASDTQTGATWGLDRVDQRALPLDTKFNYPSSAGAGVTAYIIDTGILANHTDFGGRVTGGYTAINDGQGTSDCNGHGTHVAGTVGGTVYGVAKSTNLVPVRVLNCSGSGTNSGVIAGMDWVAANHTKPAVANMSLGGGASSTTDAAVDRLVSAGVTVVVAAGNSSADACNYSPARAASAITVGSTTSSDARSSFSNFGTCLDIFAPGSSITSAAISSTTATATMSGTSMASPHVAGAAALILGQNSGLTPAQVTTQLVNVATTGTVSSAGTGSPNRLLYAELGSILQQALAITTIALPNATVGTPYSAVLQATGGTSPYTWSSTGLPSGLTLATNGTISGTPTATGTSTVVATVTDAVPNTATANVSLTVVAKVLPGAFSKISPVNGATGIAKNSAKLTWAASTNATSYRVCISTSSACNSWYGPYTTTSVTFSGLRSIKIYYWQVQALNADGSVLANAGSTWSFTTAK